MGTDGRLPWGGGWVPKRKEGAQRVSLTGSRCHLQDPVSLTGSRGSGSDVPLSSPLAEEVSFPFLFCPPWLVPCHFFLGWSLVFSRQGGCTPCWTWGLLRKGGSAGAVSPTFPPALALRREWTGRGRSPRPGPGSRLIFLRLVSTLDFFQMSLYGLWLPNHLCPVTLLQAASPSSELLAT